jgi:hypothetical protein
MCERLVAAVVPTPVVYRFKNGQLRLAAASAVDDAFNPAHSALAKSRNAGGAIDLNCPFSNAAL